MFNFISESPSKIPYSKFPKFYYKLPENEIGAKIREEARSLFLTQKSKTLLSSEELKTLWNLLEKHSKISVGDEQFIDYLEYLKVRSLGGEKAGRYLTTSAFTRLVGISSNQPNVNVVQMFNYVMRKVWIEQTRIGLSFYDTTGQGYLCESDLEQYILELIPTFPQLEGLEKSFHNFYICTVLRKFFFFLDPLRTGKVKIRDILASGYLDDLLELRDEDTSKESQELNWFSAASALSVYGVYLNLDKDHNGMLSKQELAGYGSGTLTSVFLNRVFSECLTYDGEMDYKTYLDFVLALENRHEPQSLQYLFKILDVDHVGYLTAFTLNYFFKGIQEQIESHKAEPVTFEDVKNEIFDMVKPVDPTKITVKDLVNCGQGETVVSILIEFHRFWSYENRENFSIADTTTMDEAMQL